jgi:protein-tyrosine phosphatase
MEAVTNIRDLGGLRAGDRIVAPRRLIRSGSLYEMSSRDRITLETIGVGTIIDLRARWERERRPTPWPPDQTVAAPLVSDDLVSSITGRFVAGTVQPAELEDWWELAGVYEAPYRHLKSMQRIFTVFASAPSDEAVLFHCRGGKDRTGIVAAFLLVALGVEHSEIYADFLESNAALDGSARTADLEELRRFLERHQLPASAEAAITGVRRSWLERLFSVIAERSGSLTGYLRNEVGLGSAGIKALRDRYLLRLPGT